MYFERRCIERYLCSWHLTYQIGESPCYFDQILEHTSFYPHVELPSPGPKGLTLSFTSIRFARYRRDLAHLAARIALRHDTRRGCRNWPYRASGVYAITARTIVAGCGELPSKHRYQVSRARFEEALGFWLSVSVVVGVRQPLFLIHLRCPIGFQFATRKRKRDGSIARQVHSRGKRNCQFHPILYTVRNNKTYMNLSTQVIHICISLF